jgi:hypothetical protein
LDDLGRLVVLEYVLAGERFEQYSGHLALADRGPARSILQNQRAALRERLRAALQEAYGTVSPRSPAVVVNLEPTEHMYSLEPSLEAPPLRGPTLKSGLEELIDRMLAHQFPAHPEFPVVVTALMIERVLGEVRRAIRTEDGRIEVDDKTLRPVLRQVAQPLRLGVMHELPFLLDHHWADHFNRKLAEAQQAGEVTVTVERLRAWIDDPQPMGLSRELQNLVLLVFAEQADRGFFLRGAPYQVTVERIDDEVELRAQELPDEQTWKAARERARSLLDVQTSDLCNAANVGQLVADLRARAEARKPSCDAVVSELARRLGALDVDEAAASRLQTAETARDVLGRILASTDVVHAVDALANADLPAGPEVVGESITKADEVLNVLRSDGWPIIEAAVGRPDAISVLDELRQAVAQDELHVRLAPAVDAAIASCAALLKPIKPKPPKDPTPGFDVVDSGAEDELDAATATELFDELVAKLGEPTRRLWLSWEIRRRSDG